MRAKQEVEFWVRGKWHKTRAVVNPDDLCKNPECIRKIPNMNSNYRTKELRKYISEGFCSCACYEKMKEKEQCN